MLGFLLIGFSLVAVTVSIHATGTSFGMRTMLRRYAGHDGEWRSSQLWRVYLWTAVTLLGLHFMEICVWALAYLWLPAVEGLEKAVYFSLVTFTTLGYGDITLMPGPRVMSGIEAMNGILLFGWSTALFFAVVQRSWSLKHGGKQRARDEHSGAASASH